MRIELIAPGSVAAGEEVVLRVTLLNDSYEPAEVWRNQLVGPTADMGPMTIPSVEATYGQDEEALVLQPFTYYGRERLAGGFAPGQVTITASYQPPTGERLTASQDITVT